MKVLVVGGAGYIGSHVCKAMLQAGHQITVYDNLSSGLRQNLLPGSSFIEGDIQDIPSLNQACAQGVFEGLVHLAAFKAAGESMLKPEKYSINNLVGSLNLIHAAVNNHIPNFVFSSSAAVYGEPRYLPVDEKHPTVPENYYGYTKLAIEQYLQWYSKLKGLRFAALRYFNAAGYDVEGNITGLEKGPQNLLPVVMESVMGMRPKMQVFGNDYNTEDGTGIRDYVHVDDLARAHVLSMKYIADSKKDLTVNLGSEKGASVMDIIHAVQEVSGKSVPFELAARRPGDPAKLIASSSMAKNLLNWEPVHSGIKTLVDTTWNAYQKNKNAG